MDNKQVKTLCKIRDLFRSISEFESDFQKKYNICLNEGTLLCSLNNNKFSSSEIATLLGLTNSNTSKVIKSVEKKGLIKRTIGEQDKRQMYFVLTSKGHKVLETIKCSTREMPETLTQVME